MTHMTDLSQSTDKFQELLDQGTRHYHNHHYPEALEAFEEAEKLNPASSDLHLHRANTYFQMDQYDRARSSFEAAIMYDPMEGSAYLNLGKMFFKMEQYGLAAYYWELSKTLIKNNQNLWLNLGLAYDKLYEPDKAMNAYSIYIGLSPSATETAKLQVRFDKGRKVFENNIQIADECLKKGERAKATDILRKELMVYPGTPKVYKMYASLLYQSGQLKDALHFYLKVNDAKKQEQSLDPTVMINLGVIYEKLDCPIAALWAYHQVITNKLQDYERVTPHHARLLEFLQLSAFQLVPAYLQSIRDMLRLPMQAEEGKRRAEYIEAIKSFFPEHTAEIGELYETACETFSPSLRAAKTYFNMGEDARSQGRFDRALDYYQKYLIMQSKGDKASQARKHIQEIKQRMGAVVSAMMQTDMK